MTSWQDFSQDTLRTAAVASVATTVAAAACGALEDGKALAPINAISHIVWGDKAATKDGASWKYTMTGLALNTAAITGWAAVHELLFPAGKQRNMAGALLGGACVSALAYVTDYGIVPRRLTPGFETRLSNRALLGIYAVLAVSLGLGSKSGSHHEAQ